MDDIQTWLARRALTATPDANRFNAGTPDSEFQRDRARLIHSAAFRRLQSKTQILGPGDGDFYRTRLTHSLEVSQIGSGIAEFLRTCPENRPYLEWIPSFSLIEAICLAHDIGHPPFGHGGETALNYKMHPYGGFEGNGQTLRILARLGEYSEQEGLNLTRRVMLGTIKYPCFYDQVAQYPDNIRQQAAPGQSLEMWQPPKCIYRDEEDVLAWLLAPFSQADQEQFCAISPKAEGHHRSRYKALDTAIMEIADDIAYGIHDFEDAVSLALFRKEQWQHLVLDRLNTLPQSEFTVDIAFYSEKLFDSSPRERKHAISRLVAFLMNSVVIHEQSAFEHPLLRYNARLQPEAAAVLALFKSIIFQHVIQRPAVQHIRYKGQYIIAKLFDVFLDSPELLPSNTFQRYKASPNPPRVIADYISGMTDTYAGKMYHRLFSPNTGSVFDML